MNLGETFNKLNKIYEAKERLNEGEKINISDYDQEHEIDSYVIVYDDGDKLDSNSHLLHRKYLKKDWENQLYPKLDEFSNSEEVTHSAEGDCLIDISTDNLTESERYDTIESAGKALKRLINKLYKIGWPIELRKIKDDKYEIDFDFLDLSGFGTSYSIKPLIFKRTAYLELEEKFTKETTYKNQLVEGKK